ncbi:hypothetical protein EMIHUDRAFT_124485, partial [Emiliania huxleyi CCMP1516]|uniref:Right handed beta helix domain-containing protein n=2 Tax=Emiliania huxleyi TaxID=2903 RepID=A0A0D3IPT0_EMIH1
AGQTGAGTGGTAGTAGPEPDVVEVEPSSKARSMKWSEGRLVVLYAGPCTLLARSATREGATLDGEKLSSMFDIKGGCSLSLYALRFVNGRSERYGGAVKVYNAGNIAMQDVSFTDCESGMYGGAVYVRKTRGDISLVGVTFRSCKARQGGAVLVLESGATSMDGATFIACTADL